MARKQTPTTNPYADPDPDTSTGDADYTGPKGSAQSVSQPRNPIGVPYYVTDPATGLPQIDPKTGKKVRWTAEREYDYANQLSVEGYPAGPAQVAPRFFAGDERKPGNWLVDDMIELQRFMVSVGMVKSGTYGVWNEPWAKAYADVLGFANSAGLTEGEALLRWAEYATEVAGPERAPLVVRTSNPEDLKRVFRKAIIDELGQGWDTAKIDSMVAAYQQAETQAQTEAYNLGETGGTVTDAPTPAAFAAARAQAEDPSGVQARDALGYEADFFQMLSGVVD